MDNKEYLRQWRIKNREKIKEYRKKNAAKRYKLYRDWVEANRERHRKGRNEWADRNRERLREYHRKWEAAHYNSENKKSKNDTPKQKVRFLLRNEIRAGRIIRPSACSACHVACHPDAHHADYSKPFDVIWLCRKCHSLRHRKHQ